MKNGFIKVAAATPTIRVADPSYNVEQLLRIAKDAAEHQVHVLVFPELCITGSTCADLFYSNHLLEAAKKALARYLSKTKDWNMVSVVGVPFIAQGKLYSCGAVCHFGRLLGIVPKTHLSTSQMRYFSAIGQVTQQTIVWEGAEIPFGSDLLFLSEELPALKLGVELGEDLFAPLPPSSLQALAGATLICNPSASNEIVGRAESRVRMIRAHAARTGVGYVYANAGNGESTTDLVFAGHDLICEGDELLAEKAPFATDSEWIVSEIDTERLTIDRRKQTASAESYGNYREIRFSLGLSETEITRKINPHPFLPTNPEELDRRCETILSIQTAGLKQRVERAYAKKLVIGISGGLDSTLALLVMVRAMDALKRPRKDILAVTMPCFGTTQRTKNNATVLCEELGVDFRCVDIFDAVNVHFRDIGHDPNDRNVTYENSQARERTQILMDIANDCGGMVIGTGDLSELALGWATYNGDHMSMYGVNGGIPKTLIRHIVAYCAKQFDAMEEGKIADALRDVLDTPVSPELLPAKENGEIEQKTEDLVGPYEIHDFYLYYTLRYGFSPAKLYRLAQLALGDRYDKETLLKWLKTFVRRFFSQQFKRSCLPDGPKVGSVGVSPRGDWMMPSDASVALWLKEADSL